MIKDQLNYMFKERELIMLEKVTDKRLKGFKKNAILREIMKDEIIIEFDSEDKKLVDKLITKTLQMLQKDGYKFFVYSHKGKSPHIHIYNIEQLKDLDPTVVYLYKQLFIKKYGKHYTVDLSLARNGQLIAMEFKPHFKYNITKELIFSNDTKPITTNLIDIDLMVEALDKAMNIRKRNIKYQKQGDYSWFLNWFLNTELKVGGIDLLILKNVAIAVVNMGINANDFLEKVFEIKGKKMYNQLKGWIKWAEMDRRYFRKSEIEMYGNRHNIDFSEVLKKWIIWKL